MCTPVACRGLLACLLAVMPRALLEKSSAKTAEADESLAMVCSVLEKLYKLQRAAVAGSTSHSPSLTIREPGCLHPELTSDQRAWGMVRQGSRLQNWKSDQPAMDCPGPAQCQVCSKQPEEP